jgi:tetratricopeptide (TPR) repeat protein
MRSLINKSFDRIFVFALCAISVHSLRAQDADKLYPSNGAPVTGKIAEMTRNNVVMEVRGVKENFQAIDIKYIVYEGEPAAFTKAKEVVETEQWDEALDSLKKVDLKSILREETKKEFEFYVGLVQARLAMSGQGDPAAADARLLNFVKGNTNSFHFFDTSDVLGSLAASTGRHDQAVKYFSVLASSPFPAQKLKAQYSLGLSNLAVGKIAEGRTAFGEALAGATDDVTSKRYKKLASIGVIRCETAEKKYDAAIEKLRKLVSDSDATDNELFAQLYNALGEAHLQAGQEEEAVLAYLHTDLLFTSDPDSHAEALYHLIQLFTKLDPPRVAETKARLQSLYANSAWAKKG